MGSIRVTALATFAAAALAACLLTTPPRSHFESGGTGGATGPGGGGGAGGANTTTSGSQAGGAGGGQPAKIQNSWHSTSETPFDFNSKPMAGDLLVLAVLIDTDFKACTPTVAGYAFELAEPEADKNTSMSLDLRVYTRSATGDDAPNIDCMLSSGNGRWVATLVSLRPGAAPLFTSKSGAASRAQVGFPMHAPGWMPLLFVGDSDADVATCSGWQGRESAFLPGGNSISLAALYPENIAHLVPPSCHNGPGWVAIMAGVGPG